MSGNDAQRLFDSLQQERTAAEARSSHIVAAFQSMTDQQRHRATVVQYRCRKGGCWPIFVWRLDDVVAVYLRSFRLSARHEKDTSKRSARDKHTTGNGVWPARGLLLDDLRGYVGTALPVKCYHLDRYAKLADLEVDVHDALNGRSITRWF